MFVREWIVRIDRCPFFCPGDDVMNGVFGVHFCDPVCFCGGDVEAGVVHTQGAEQVLHEVILEIFSTDDLDEAAEDVDTEAVHPFLAGLVDERQFAKAVDAIPESVFNHTEPGGDARLCIDGPTLLCADAGIVEPGGVGEEMTEGDGLFGRNGSIAAVRGIEFIEDLHVFEGGDEIADGFVEVEPALLEQLHGGDADDGFCLAGDAKEVVAAHWFVCLLVGITISFILDDVAILYDEGDDAVDPAFVDTIVHENIYALKAAAVDGGVGGDDQGLGRGCAEKG